MLRLPILALCAASAFAQTAADTLNKPSAKVDQVLRGRILEFYQYHTNQEYRKAEALVAQDTKDFFYVQNKPHYLSCEIRRIDYSDSFKKAKATMACKMYVVIPGFTDRPLTVPFSSTWKVVKGKWYWYVDPEVFTASPMGKMVPGPPSDAPLPPMVTDDAQLHDTQVDFLFGLVKADKPAVTVKPGDSEQVTIANSAPGTMNLSVESIPGVEAKLDKTSLNSKEKAVLTIQVTEGAKSGSLRVTVAPTGQVISIQVTVK